MSQPSTIYYAVLRERGENKLVLQGLQIATYITGIAIQGDQL